MVWQSQTPSFQKTQTTVMHSEGLRQHMLKVYNYMSLGIAVTAIVAMFVAYMSVQDGQLTQLGTALFKSPLRYLVMLAPLGIIMLFSVRFAAMSLSALQGIYWLYAGTMGVSLATVFVMFPKADIVSTAAVTSLTFGAMSLWGYTTKKDLTSMGSFLMMGLIGIIVASLVNLFMQSGMMSFILSCAGALIFTGLTAYDTQRIKDVYLDMEGSSAAETGKAAIAGALTLYMDFINLFLSLLNVLKSSDR
jgi:uncharacterized protein